MKTFFLIISLNLFAYAGDYGNPPETPFDEINVYFEKMGLTKKGETPKELKASKRDIILGLKGIYDKWNLQIDVDAPLTNEMTVCKPTVSAETKECVTWTW